MDSSYQYGICASSCLGTAEHTSVDANIETDLYRSQLFTQVVSQHEYQPLPHHLLNLSFAQPCAESSPMQFNPLNSHQEQVHRLFQPSQQLSFTPVEEQRQTQQKPAAIGLHRLLGIEYQSHHLPENTRKTVQTWTGFLPQNDGSGHQKPPELPRRLLPDAPSASADSTCRTDNVHFVDWMSQAYRELQSVREMHLSDLSKLYMKVCCACLQLSSTEQGAKLEHSKSSIERMVQFLNTPGTEIIRFNKDKFYYSLYTIIKYVHTYKNKVSVPIQVYMQSLSHLPLLQQWFESKLQSQAGNTGSSGNSNLQLSKTELNRNMIVAGVDLKNVSSSLQIGSSGQSPLAPSTLQQTKFRPTTVPPNSATSSAKNTRHTQPLKQLNNQPSNEEMKHQILIQRVKEINEKQQLEYSPRSLFPSPWLNVSSREAPPFSLGHKHPKQPIYKGSPSKSVTSPFVRDSTVQPQTPVVKSAEDPELVLGESSGCSQTYVGVTLASIEKQLLALAAPEKSASFSPLDLSFPNENQRASDKELSAKCLSEMVESMSPEALTASVKDIMSVFTLIDTLCGEMVTCDSFKTICGDLAADTVHHSQRSSSSFLSKSTTLNMMKRKLSSSCNEKDSDGSLTCKKQRTQAPLDDAVLEEIKQTNKSLIETVVDVASGFKEDVDAVVRCSYSAVGLDFDFNQQNTSFTKLPILLVELLLPEDYPNSSPRVLNTSSISWSEAGESENLSERAKLMFSLSLRKLSEPFSLRDMARVWDFCARSVLSEFSQSFGGGSFSSIYGTWESCLS